MNRGIPGFLKKKSKKGDAHALFLSWVRFRVSAYTRSGASGTSNACPIRVPTGPANSRSSTWSGDIPVAYRLEASTSWTVTPQLSTSYSSKKGNIRSVDRSACGDMGVLVLGKEKVTGWEIR